jgi:cysteine desulfurase
MSGRRHYFDYAATTPVRPPVRTAMAPHLNDAYGNPSSIHSLGREARLAIDDARRRLSKALGAADGQLVFTGSGSEADNLAITGFARRHPGGCVIHTSIEHKAVIEAAAAAVKAFGYDVRIVPVNANGEVDLTQLADLLPADDRPTLVAVMWANNETGVVQPLEAVARLCSARGATLFSDAVQGLGKIDLRLEQVDVDLVAFSAHKVGGPKGTGALLIRRGVRLEPLIYGGGQEGGYRSGTENVAGVVGFAEAVSLAAAERQDETQRLGSLRDRLEAGLKESLPEIVVNGGAAMERLPNVLNLSIPAVDIEGLLTSLDLEGICVSSGSACTTGSVSPSHVITALGRRGELARNTIRFSLGWGTQAQDIEYVLEVFPKIVDRVRKFASEA